VIALDPEATYAGRFVAAIAFRELTDGVVCKIESDGSAVRELGR
jgi:hypothetical protein